MGAILTPGRRTVAAALRVVGLEQAVDFTNYHRVLNRNRWSSRWVARCLFRVLVNNLVPTGPVVMGLDDTIERRWGAKIKARGIYRGPARSSHGHFVKAVVCDGCRSCCCPRFPWAGRIWALPFLTVLAPSKRYARKHRQRHKKLTDCGRQVMLQVARWLPDRQIVSVTDSGFAAIELLNAVRHRICMIIRLGLDARRPRVVGRRQPLLVQRLANSRTCWRRITRPPGAESAMCWFTTLPMSSSHRLFCALISMPTRSTSFAGSSAVVNRGHLPKSAVILVSRRNGTAFSIPSMPAKRDHLVPSDRRDQQTLHLC